MAREAGTPPTLKELMGKKADAVSLGSLPDVLGEKMPEMEFNSVGKLRLLRALKNRFGAGFKNIPGVKNVIGEFDKEIRLASLIKMNREKRNG